MNDPWRVLAGVVAFAAWGASFACGEATSSGGGGTSGGASSGGETTATTGGASAAKGGATSGGSSGGSAAAGSGGSDNACSVAADCAWGEIDHEIVKKTDCVCLLGCPFIPQSKATVARRQAQYAALCTPGKDGQGQPCPIDDCIEAPPLSCLGGVCAR